MAVLKMTYPFWSRVRHICKRGKLESSHAFHSGHFDMQVKGSTLMETLVATVLIVIVFMVSSMILNNLMLNKARKNTALAEERIQALEYKYLNEGIALPYYEDFESWEISMTQQNLGSANVVAIEAENHVTKAKVTNYVAHED